VAETERLNALLSQAFADVWTGLDPDAAPVRDAVRTMLSQIIRRAHDVTRGESSKQYARLLAQFVAAQTPAGQPANEPDVGAVPPEQQAARRLAQALLAALPPSVRTLDALLAELAARTQTQTAAPAPPAPPSPDAESAAEPAAAPDAVTARDLADVLLTPAQLAAAWPSQDKLRKLLRRRLNALKKISCLSAGADIATWVTYVPARAATSFGVAAALQAAFKALNFTGLTASNLNLGNAVHDRMEQNAAVALSVLTDRYLVAEEHVYPPLGGGIARDLFGWADYIRNTQKEFSLNVLLQSRGGRGAIRGRGRSTSREDLVVFYRSDIARLLPPFVSGRPEVYEVKAVGSAVEAVSQVTAYSFNYLVASIRTQCLVMPAIPMATLDNAVMLPGSPEYPSIPVPTITITELAAIGTVSVAPPVAAAQIALIVQQFLAATMSIPPYLVVPFMVSGLYGVVPYFVIDVSKMQAALQAMLQAIIEALVAALLAYLAAKEALKKLLDQVATALHALLGIVLFLAICVVMAILFWPAIVAIAAELSLVLAAALILIVVQGTTKPDSAPPQDVDARVTPLSMYAPPFVVHGVTAEQIAQFASTMHRWTLEFCRRGAFPAAGPPTAA
jgi:hypothetical protein